MTSVLCRTTIPRTWLQRDPAHYQRGSLGLVKIVELDESNAYRHIRVPIVAKLA